MRTAPDYAMASVDRMTGTALDLLIASMPTDLVAGFANGLKRTVAEKRRFVSESAADYWDAAVAAPKIPTHQPHTTKPPPKRLPSLHTITASECNAWLATLPETPFYGAET